MPNYHKLVGLKQQRSFLLWWERLEVQKKKKKVSSRRYALWGSRGEYFHFFCCFWWNQIFLGLSLCDSNLCLHLQMAFSPVGLYISSVPLFSLIGTIVTEFGAHYKHRIISSQDPQLNYVFKESISK